MLTREQESVLRKIGIYEYANLERNGQAYYIDHGKKKKFIIPQFSEILQMMFDKIREAGFTEIKRCHPNQANCIIRVYQDLHHEHQWGECYNLYGAACYTKREDGLWETMPYKNPRILEVDKHYIRDDLCPDEVIVFETVFLDCPLLIS